MRRQLALAMSVLAAALLAGHAVAQPPRPAPTLSGTWKNTEVRVDDQILSRGVVAAGKSDGSTMDDVYVPLAAFATALNGTPVLEPSLMLAGNELLVIAVSRSVAGKTQRKGLASAVAVQKVRPEMSKGFYEWIKASTVTSKDAAKMTIKFDPEANKEGKGMNVLVNGAGLVSKDVRMFDGKAVIPIKDIARAFGGDARFAAGHYEIGSAH